MIVHGNVELLSSFVDDELEPPLRRQVESHLADCPPCRERIGGLRRVVTELRALEVVAPPAGLAGRVRRAILLDDERSGGLRRSAESLRRWTDQPFLLPLFGVITALAVLLYLFSAWFERAEHPGTRLVVGSAEAAPAAPIVDGEVVEIEGRFFVAGGGGWIERGVDPADAAEVIDSSGAPGADAGLEPFRRLGGRVFLRHGGRVVEVTFDSAAP